MFPKGTISNLMRGRFEHVCVKIYLINCIACGLTHRKVKLFFFTEIGVRNSEYSELADNIPRIADEFMVVDVIAPARRPLPLRRGCPYYFYGRLA